MLEHHHPAYRTLALGFHHERRQGNTSSTTPGSASNSGSTSSNQSTTPVSSSTENSSSSSSTSSTPSSSSTSASTTPSSSSSSSSSSNTSSSSSSTSQSSSAPTSSPTNGRTTTIQGSSTTLGSSSSSSAGSTGTPASSSSSSSGGLSSGAVTAICVIGGIAGFAILFWIAVQLLQSKRRKREAAEMEQIDFDPSGNSVNGDAFNSHNGAGGALGIHRSTGSGGASSYNGGHSHSGSYGGAKQGYAVNRDLAEASYETDEERMEREQIYADYMQSVAPPPPSAGVAGVGSTAGGAPPGVAGLFRQPTSIAQQHGGTYAPSNQGYPPQPQQQQYGGGGYGRGGYESGGYGDAYGGHASGAMSQDSAGIGAIMYQQHHQGGGDTYDNDYQNFRSPSPPSATPRDLYHPTSHPLQLQPSIKHHNHTNTTDNGGGDVYGGYDAFGGGGNGGGGGLERSESVGTAREDGYGGRGGFGGGGLHVVR